MRNITIVVALALVFISFSAFETRSNVIPTTDNLNNDSESGLFAYINMDSIYAKYMYAIEMKDSIKMEEQKIADILKEVHLSLSRDKANFEINIEHNDSLTEVQKEEARQRLNRDVEDVHKLYDKMDNYIDQYQRDVFERVNDAIAEHISDFSKTTGYMYIFVNSSSGWDLYTSDKYDLTDDFVRFMNERYLAIQRIGTNVDKDSK